MEDTKDIRYRYMLNRLGELVKNYEDNIASIQLEILALRESTDEKINHLQNELENARQAQTVQSPPPVPLTEV